ncbi:MAG TPA: cell envelope integrity protein TolA [Coxiellaceae bacterium]|nr:cell envelope integrity protein TolA [Coxiellaceae bacterium]HBY55600.1 cell envelope integrity protein TolA [Coxiellaceae bacterium]
MRNKLLFIFLAIVALGLTGCGKEEESTITTIDVDQQQESAVAPAVNSVDSSSQTLLNQNNQVTNEKNTQVNPPALPPASVPATPGNAPAAAIESSQNQSQQSNPIQVSGQQNVSDASVIQTQSPAPSQAQAQAQAQEQAHGHRLQGEVDKYKALILQAISSQWIIPEGVDSKSVCRLLINVAPGGVVLNVQLVSSSGNLALDRSAQAAVLKASPLPVPEDVSLFDRVRTINLTVRPEGMVGN